MIMMKGQYELLYYTWKDGICVVHSCDVLVPITTYKELTSKKSGAFVKFIINDGEDLIVNIEAIHSLRQEV